MASKSLSVLKVAGMTDDGQVTEPTEDIGLRAQVEGNQGYKAGNELEVFWNNVSVFKHLITLIEETAGVPFFIEKKYIALGDVKTYYTLKSGNGNIVTSPVLSLKVIPAT